MMKTKGFSYFLPYFFLFLIITVRFIGQRVVFFNDYTPFYELIFIYSWSFITQFHWNVFVIAFIGLLRDLIFIDILGTSIMVFVVFVLLINSQREKIENRGFLLSWIYFAVILLVTVGLRLIVFYFFQESHFNTMLWLSLKESYFSVVSYPLFFLLFLLPYMQTIKKT